MGKVGAGVNREIIMLAFLLGSVHYLWPGGGGGEPEGGGEKYRDLLS